MNSGTFDTAVTMIVFNFSKKGPEFFEATAYGEIDPQTRQMIEAKKQENTQLMQQNIQENFSGPLR